MSVEKSERWQSLFRPEVLQHQHDRLLGEAIRFRPLPSGLTLMAAGCVAGFATWVSTALYTPLVSAQLIASDASGKARLLIDAPSSELRRIAPGTILSLTAKPSGTPLSFEAQQQRTSCPETPNVLEILGTISPSFSSSAAVAGRTDVTAQLPARRLLGGDR